MSDWRSWLQLDPDTQALRRSRTIRHPVVSAVGAGIFMAAALWLTATRATVSPRAFWIAAGVGVIFAALAYVTIRREARRS